MIYALLLCTLAQDPVLESLVTYQGPTANLATIVDEVGASAGVKITVQGAPQRDWIYLQVKDRPLRKVLDLVAQGTQSKWTKSAPGQFTISAPWNPNSPDPAAREDIRAWLEGNPIYPPFDRREAERIVAEGIAALALPEGHVRDQQLASLESQTPVARALLATVHAVGASRLAEATVAPISLRIHTSDQSRLLPAAAQQAFAKIPGELYAYQEAMARQGIGVSEGHQRAPFPSIWQPGAPSSQGPAADWKVTICKAGPSLSVEACRLDAGGRYQAPFQSISLSLRSSPAQRGDFALIPDQPMAWSSEAKALIRPPHIQNGGGPYPKAVIERLTQCADHEVFTAGLEPAFAAWAKHSGRDIFAVVPDDAFDKIANEGVADFTVRQTLSWIYIAESRLHEFDGAYVLTPNLRSVRRSRVPRAEAQQFYREIAEVGHAALDTIGDLCAAASIEEAYQLAASRARSFSKPSPDVPFNFPLLAIYASLTGPQRAAAASETGVILPFSSMSLAQKAAVGSLMNAPSQYFFPRHVTNHGTPGDENDPGSVTSNERANLKLHVRRIEKINVYDLAQESKGFNAEVDPRNLAYKTPKWLENARFRVGASARLEISLELPRRGFLDHSFEIIDRPSAPLQLAFAQLPKSFRDAAEKAIEEHKRALAMPRDTNNSAAGTRTAPPPKPLRR